MIRQTNAIWKLENKNKSMKIESSKTFTIITTSLFTTYHLANLKLLPEFVRPWEYIKQKLSI